MIIPFSGVYWTISQNADLRLHWTWSRDWSEEDGSVPTGQRSQWYLAVESARIFYFHKAQVSLSVELDVEHDRVQNAAHPWTLDTVWSLIKPSDNDPFLEIKLSLPDFNGPQVQFF